MSGATLFAGGVAGPMEDRVLVALYRRCYSIERLSRMVGRSRTYVRRRLVDAGIPIRPSSPKGRHVAIDSRGYACWGKSRVHRIVCEAWYGTPPTPRHQVNHKDGDKLNNHPDNLEWVTLNENHVHAIRHGLIWSLFSDNQVRAIRYLRGRGVLLRAIAAALGVPDTGKVSRIARGTYYAHVPDGEVLAAMCPCCGTPGSELDALLAEAGAPVSQSACPRCERPTIESQANAELARAQEAACW